MTAIILLVAFLIFLGVASARGWSVDSRDPAYNLGAPWHRPAAVDEPRLRPGRATTGWRRLRDFVREQTELQERLLLINRPWEREFLHWSGTGSDTDLHGHLVPDGRHGHGATRGGWCACAAHRRPAEPR